jgi:23S rRNA pseudouridine2605 synthase
MVRLQKFLADAGVASRRSGEQLILEGRVAVNGEVVRQLGTKVDPAHDRVALDGTPLRTRRKLYLALHKPRRVICTRSDPHGRRTVFDLLPREWTNVYPVGRLDWDSEGLLLLTNDGEFCLRVTHPRYEVRKLYRVSIAGRVPAEALRQMEKGVHDEGERLKAERARVVDSGPDWTLLELTLAEGKNREVRRMMECLGLEVQQLKRVQIGKIKLGELPAGRWRTLTDAEIKSLILNHE